MKDFPERIPTSQLFGEILAGAPASYMTMAWFFGNLRERSFGMVMLFLGLIAMVPGICVLAGFVLLVLGFQMMMGREVPILPRLISLHPLPTIRVAWLIVRTIPIIKALERFVRPRWHMPFVATKRLVGLTIIMLAATLFLPIPLSNVIPGALTMLVALAYLEEDGIFLCIALSAAVGSLAITMVVGWASIKGVGFLLRA